MKTGFLIMILLFGLNACAAEQGTQVLSNDFNRQGVERFVRIQETRPQDILAKFGNPSAKGVYSDGRSSLLYTSVCGEGSPSDVKMASFIFGSNGLLEEWKYDENLSVIQRSKFSNVLDSGNAEIQRQGEMIALQYEDIRPGMQSGRVFATLGKPFHAQDDADNRAIHYYFYFKNQTLQKKYWVKTVPYAQ